MKECKGYIDSIYSGSAVDGKGLRVVVFFSGCNLNCPFCHNPETLFEKGKEFSVAELVGRIKRYSHYIRNGGVTLSGGEPFLQVDFVLALIKELNNNGIKVAIETNGSIINRDIIAACEYLICDVKNQTSDDLSCYDEFLTVAESLGKKVEITCVIVPTVNDTDKKLLALKDLIDRHKNTVLGVRLLPFKKLCVEKYKKLGKTFLYEDKDECSKEIIDKAHKILN